MSKKQSTHTVVTKVTNSPSTTQSKNSQKKRSRKPKVAKDGFVSKTVSVSVASSARLKSQKPITSNISNGIRVKHTELIGPVAKAATQSGYVDGTDLIQAFRLRCNPASAKTFDWLSKLAVNFESYRFLKLSFYFETRSPTTTPGSIIISPDYDAADGQVALNEKHLFANKGTVDDAVWKHLRCNLPSSCLNRLYKSHVNMTDDRFDNSSQDEKTIDCAQVFVCIDTADAAAFKFGKLFVSYEVDLTEPQDPTEPPNEGGLSVALPVDAGSGSTTPLNTIFNLVNLKIDEGVLTPNTSLPELVTFPSATIGRFMKDYVGVAINRATGTNITSSTLLYLGSNPNTPAGSAGDTLIPTSTSFPAIADATAANNVIVRNIAAAAGQYLKMRNPVYSTLTTNFLELGGVKNLF